MKYSNGELEVRWDKDKCTHSANCVRRLSDVFRPKEHPWIKMDEASSD
ncbi:MAG: (4Fe-4S)-binding protein [Flavobacteriales bacterium]|nr:(4Fe-4S)-binding protein [Flavobacteriales bacterium]